LSIAIATDSRIDVMMAQRRRRLEVDHQLEFG